MSYDYATPGVYIDEITNPGVISGVTTNVTAFIGPAARGPLLTPIRITSFNEFLVQFGRDLGAGKYWPHLPPVNSRIFSLGYALQGFFENGGGQAVVVRVGSGSNASWNVLNNAHDIAFRIESIEEGAAGGAMGVVINSCSLTNPTTSSTSVTLATTSESASTCNGFKVTMSQTTTQFHVGDVIEIDDSSGSALKHTSILGLSSDSVSGAVVLDVSSDVTVSPSVPFTVRIANIEIGRKTFRLDLPFDHVGPGSLLAIYATGAGTTISGYGLVDRVDHQGFVTLRRALQDASGHDLAAPIGIAAPTAAGTSQPSVRSVEFEVIIEDGSGVAVESKQGLSLDPIHPGYVFRAKFETIKIVSPAVASPTMGVWPAMVAMSSTALAGPNVVGVDDDPETLSADDYKAALEVLHDVDDVSLVCAPDAGCVSSPLISQMIQAALVEHCLALRNRMALLDVGPGISANQQSELQSLRSNAEASGGFAALYYPQVLVAEPVLPGNIRPITPNLLGVPVSGHMAGIMARLDEQFGVHYPPANTEVRGVYGLEQILSDRQQGPLNKDGINVLRVFPGEAQVKVWGARTTAPDTESDWTYINVRRLLIYIERSIQRGIRWAVFKPNDYTLWQGLKRTISDFLERIWKSGGLLGKTRDQAFRVRIDDQLNTPTTIALGQLHIEIFVAPVRPAEFIVVHIGLWDGGATVTES